MARLESPFSACAEAKEHNLKNIDVDIRARELGA